MVEARVAAHLFSYAKVLLSALKCSFVEFPMAKLLMSFPFANMQQVGMAWSQSAAELARSFGHGSNTSVMGKVVVMPEIVM